MWSPPLRPRRPAVTLRVYSHVLRKHAAGVGDIFAPLFAEASPSVVEAAVSKSVSKQERQNERVSVCASKSGGQGRGQTGNPPWLPPQGDKQLSIEGHPWSRPAENGQSGRCQDRDAVPHATGGSVSLVRADVGVAHHRHDRCALLFGQPEARMPAVSVMTIDLQPLRE